MITVDKSNKNFWSYIKSQRKENTGVSDLVDNNKLVSTPKEKADVLNNQFSKVFSQPCNKTYKKPDLSKFSETLNSIKVSPNGVLKLMENINDRKATGPDDIPGKLLKICSFELHEIFVILFQQSLDLGTIPDDWKSAHIFPLYKKGDRTYPVNYRPISLTCVPCKLLEHIVFSTSSDFLDRQNFFTSFQHGFRQKRSCESQILTTLKDFTNFLNSSAQTDAVLLDFSKAFDKVDHKLLLSKINNAGIHGPLLNWMTSFLTNRLQYVVVEGSISNPSNVLSGVPQGTVLGPLFFLIYINDICDNLTPGTFIRLFADDSLLYRVIKTDEDIRILQKDLDTLQEWEKKNKMEFDADKCQVLRISNKLKPIEGTYNIHGTPLKLFTSVKYFITLDSNLNWSEQCNNVFNKASFMMSFLERYFK